MIVRFPGFVVLILAWIFTGSLYAQTTYCNPINIDYTYMIYNAHEDISYRSGADPAVVEFRGKYYMFVTRSMGYWHSRDLLHWDFIKPERWYFEGCNAPAARNYKDSVLYVAGDPLGSMSILYTDDPKKGDWQATPAIVGGLIDPDLFIDDDGQTYVFWGSSNVYPIRAKKLDRNERFRPGEMTYDLINLDEDEHGWERFGENHADTVLGGYLEGPWMIRYKGKYYLQYAAPGTEFNVYGDGVYTSDAPLGPYTYAPNNPVAYKPGGFANGTGHGSAVVDLQGRYWHFGTMALAVNVGWERRITQYPMYFDQDGLMYSDTYFGDYPRYAPDHPDKAGEFRNWMLLSYNKAVKASSAKGAYLPANINDENIKTFWVANYNDDDQWIEIDLGAEMEVYAVQINYHDFESDFYGRIKGLFHRYTIAGSTDGKQWTTFVDKSRSFQDTPNGYVELSKAQKLRYLRFNNIHTPTKNLSISDLRVFGLGQGKAPGKVKDFSVERKTDRRDAILNWRVQNDSQGYNVLWGIAPDKLYSSWLVYGKNSLELKCLTKKQSYYFAIEAFNENGISGRSEVVLVQ